MSKKKQKICIIAGEASGDNIGASLIAELKKKRSQIEIYGVGGKKMLQAGLSSSFFPMDEISLMGIVEILPHFFRLRKLLHDTAANIIELQPDVLITIDAPAFTNRLVKMVKAKDPNLNATHIVAPSVWAYNPGRAQKLAQYYDLLLTLLPFEPQYFAKHDLESHFIGHPIFTQDFSSDREVFCVQHNIDQNNLLLAITPGSRVGEIKRHLPVFIEAAQKLQLAIPARLVLLFCLNNQKHAKYIEQYRKQLGSLRYHIIAENVLQGYGAADVALAKSGTNTLEIVACGTPQVIGYKMNPITSFLIKIMIKIKFACLVNIMAGKMIIPEFIQENCTSSKLSEELTRLVTSPKYAKLQVTSAQHEIKACGFKQKVNPGAVATKIIIDKFL